MTGPAGRVDDNGAGSRPTPPVAGVAIESGIGASATHEARIMVDVPDQPGGSLAVPDTDPQRRVDALHDPDLDDPLIAAVRYRTLLAELNQARSKVADRVLAGQERRAALARAHRESAEAIRSKVEEVWRTVAEPLAHHGISNLDQLRPPPSDQADHNVPAVTRPDHAVFDHDIPVVARPERGGRPIARAQHHRGEPGRTRTTGAAPQRRTRTRQAPAGAVASGAGAAVPFEPSEAPGRAHELCLTAMGHAAELRAVTRAGSSASTAIVIGLGCLLAAGGVTVLRVLLGVEALPSLTGAAVVAAVCVTALTDAGRAEVARAALLGAGTAGAAVLATVRVASLDPTDVIASLAALVLAVRFGLGVGAPRRPQRK
ncbi:hypothetical protein [Protofrankia symbiont of Coriaria ruscifolia]|nr:hypothetical protein [Protofrankia symbiont of Coriaria ruscifolia]